MRLLSFKKYIVSVTFFLLFLALPASAAERIDRYDIDMHVRKDASVDVTETIAYDFDDADKHGIFRDIPVSYSDHGAAYNLRLSDISVQNEFGIAEPYTVSRDGVNVQLKIGDPDTLITGKHTYVIRYTVQRAITYLADHDELYWNAIGTDWEVPIGEATVRVDTPSAGNAEYECYVGEMGTNTRCDIAKLRGSEILFSHEHLAPHEAFTIVVGMPVGTVTKPTVMSSFKDFLYDNWVVFLPFAALILCLLYWAKRGRDPKGRGTIIPEYDVPDNLMPAEVGTIVDERATNREVTSEIIQLARAGYLIITREEEKKFLKDKIDYVIEQIKDAGSDLRPYQKLLLEKLFSHADANDAVNTAAPGTFVHKSVRMSKLSKNFFEDFQLIVKIIYENVTSAGYFRSNPTKVRGAFVVLGILMMFGSFFCMDVAVVTGLGILVSGLIVCVFSFFMSVRTPKGVETKEKILGLKMYLTVAEKDRLEFHNAPEKNPAQFEQFLPYAVALGVEMQWADQFAGLSMQPPSWYHTGAGMQGWNAVMFANQLSQFQTTTKHSLAMPAGKGGLGGGGFSGGGFGGGGGRSW